MDEEVAAFQEFQLQQNVTTVMQAAVQKAGRNYSHPPETWVRACLQAGIKISTIIQAVLNNNIKDMYEKCIQQSTQAPGSNENLDSILNVIPDAKTKGHIGLIADAIKVLPPQQIIVLYSTKGVEGLKAAVEALERNNIHLTNKPPPVPQRRS